MKRTTLVIVGLVLAVLAVGGYTLWQQQQAAQQAAQTQIRQETVGRGTILGAVSATGPLIANTQVNLFFGTGTGTPVMTVTVALGDKVKKGDLLAELDTRDLRLAVQQAEQSLRSAQLALEQLTAPPREVDIAVAEANLRLARAQVYQASQGTPQITVEQARLNLVLAQNQLDQLYERMQRLEDSGRFAEKQALEGQATQLVDQARTAELRYQQALAAPSPGRAGSAQAAVEQAQVALDRLKNGPKPEDVQIAQLQISQAEAALRLARNNLEQAQLRAPFDGVVVSVNVRAGEPLGGAQPAVVLADVSRYYIDVLVDEVDIARIAVGQPVTVTLDALPNELFAGVVERIAPQSSLNAGVVSFPVRVALQSANPLLRGGMTATAEIIVERAENVVLAPNWAIRRDRATGQNLVSVLRDGALTEVAVQLGLRGEAYSEVRAGLNAGDVVAVSTAREAFSFFGGGN